MSTYSFAHVDAFTDTLFGGNPAGVVLRADGLTEEQMKNIAREINLSETAFVFSGDETCDFHFRYFTSGKYEVRFCGHASIAALSEIVRKWLLDKSIHTLRIKTGMGILDMYIDTGKNMYSFEAPPVQLVAYDDHEKFAKRFGLPSEVFDARYPIMRDTGLNYLYIPIKNEEILKDLKFDFAKIIQEFEKEGIIVFSLFTSSDTSDCDIYARGLAPLTGVNEDPVTGSMMAGIFTYGQCLWDNFAIKKVRQWNPLDRQWQVIIEQKNNKIVVSWSAVLFFCTMMAV